MATEALPNEWYLGLCSESNGQDGTTERNEEASQTKIDKDF